MPIDGHEEAGGNPAQSRYCDTASERWSQTRVSVFHPIEQGRTHP